MGCVVGKNLDKKTSECNISPLRFAFNTQGVTKRYINQKIKRKYLPNKSKVIHEVSPSQEHSLLVDYQE